ncbi:MAG: hypothetical protein ACI97A_003013 [Planctomycetota bacterium]|jgi:hypothetical protein
MAIKRIGITIALIGLSLVGGKFGCRAISKQERMSRFETLEQGLVEACGELKPGLRQDLLRRMKKARAQLVDDELSPIALDTLRQRFEATMADGQLYPREASHLIALLADFPHWQDEVHAMKYMGQR